MRQIVLLVVPMFAMAGCAEVARDPAPVPAAASPSTRVTASAFADEPPGSAACDRLAAAVATAALMDAGVIAEIGARSTTADAPVADAAQRLADAYAAAVAAQGSPAEPDAVAAVSAAAADMSGVCADSGLTSTG